jgi:hypothetical protein
VLDVGQTYRSTLAVVDDQGAPANPSAAALVITLPDGTTTSPAVTLPPAQKGLLLVDYKSTAAGLHQEAWSTTGPDTASADVFNVRAYVAMISIAEAMQHLNMTKPPADGGNELRRFIMATTQLVENKVGYIVPRSFTDVVAETGQGGRTLLMPRRPVMAVTSVASVWPSGPTFDPAGLDFDNDAGIIWQKTGYPFWWGPWRVTYKVGQPVFPETWEQAAKEQLRHLWKTQRGAQAPAVVQGEEEFTSTTGWSFSVPRRVLELLEQDMVPSS